MDYARRERPKTVRDPKWRNRVVKQRFTSLRLFFSRIRTRSNLLIYMPSIILVLIIAGVISRVAVVENVAVYNPDGLFSYIEISSFEEKAQTELKGDNFFSKDATDIADRLEDESPYIRDIRVSKVFPDTVELEVEERVPVAVVYFSAKCAYLDYDTYLLEYADIQDGRCLIEVGYDDGELMPVRNEDLVLESEVGDLTEYYEIQDIINTSRILADFGYTPDDVVVEDGVIKFKSGNSVYLLSSTQDLEPQLKRLVLSLQQLDTLGIQPISLDVRFEKPVMIRSR